MFSNGNGSEDYEKPISQREILRDIQATCKRMEEKSVRIDTIMFGDSQAKIIGLVDKVESHRKYISMDKKLKIFGTGLAASTGTGWAFWDVIKHLFK